MAWLKSSDNANQHPAVLAPLAWQKGPDDDLDGWDLRLPAVAGLAWLCATYSAGLTTDYVVPDATVALYGGPHWQRLAAWVARAGIWERVDGGWLLTDDSERLFHIRLKAEIEWERARKNDNGNPALTIPVRLRDGDACRYCGRVTNWKATTGALAGTYDHRHPGRPARGPDDLVVCCNQCNGRRGKDPHPERWQVLPAPAQPYYGDVSVEHLAKHGFEVPPSTGPKPIGLPGGPRIDDPRPGDQPDPAPAPPRRPGTRPDHATPGDPAPSRTTPTPHRAAASRPAPSATPPKGHRAAPRPGDQPDHATAPTRRPGTRPDHATTGDPAPSRTTPTPHRAAASRPAPSATPPAGQRASRDAAASPTPRTPRQDQQRPAGPGREPAGTAGPKPPKARDPGRVGTGRDGSGAQPQPNRKRSRRGRRPTKLPPSTGRTDQHPDAPEGHQ
ncbi:hypothetical protein AB0N38_33185 [Micromonospora aurantiaca]|uniref:HNH endonuclease n=1 Tax=Micromonospora aurantiaca (nom. illeg.) TaxID=47850 RepID=UPI00343DD50D